MKRERIRHDPDKVIVPLLPHKARESMSRASTIPSKKVESRSQMKSRLRRHLEKSHLEDV